MSLPLIPRNVQIVEKKPFSGMYNDLGQKMHGLFSRHSVLIDKRIELFLLQMDCEAYYGGSVGQRTLDEGKKICKQAERPDLELMVVEECWRINSRGQYPQPEQPEELAENVKQLEELIEKGVSDCKAKREKKRKPPSMEKESRC